MSPVTLTYHIDAGISKDAIAIVESVLTVENLHLNPILHEKTAAVAKVLDDDNNKGVTTEAAPAIEGIRVGASAILSLEQPIAGYQILDNNENTVVEHVLTESSQANVTQEQMIVESQALNASNNIIVESPTKEPYLHVFDAVSQEKLNIQNENLPGDDKSSSIGLVPANEMAQPNGSGARAQERAVDEASKAGEKDDVVPALKDDSKLANVEHEGAEEEG